MKEGERIKRLLKHIFWANFEDNIINTMGRKGMSDKNNFEKNTKYYQLILSLPVPVKSHIWAFIFEYLCYSNLHTSIELL